MIFISNGSYPGSCLDFIREFVSGGITHLELSYALKDDPVKEILGLYKDKCSFRFHNYFPPPCKEFVINLASVDKKISSLSLRHCKNAIDFCKDFKIPYYSVHAGFLIDPRPEELGKILDMSEIYPRDRAMTAFRENVSQLIEYCKEQDIKLLLENNVCSAKNFEKFSGNICLMADCTEIIDVMQFFSGDCGLLLDVGHLNVSSKTLGFSRKNTMKKLSKYIKAYHLSDNNRLEDLHSPFDKNSWFLPYLDRSLDMTIEIKKADVNMAKSLRSILLGQK